MNKSSLPEAWVLEGTEESRPLLGEWLDYMGYESDSYGEGGWKYFIFPNWSTHDGFELYHHTSDTISYNGSKGELISLEDFKHLAFTPKLPEEYIVHCSNREETTNVVRYYYNYPYDFSHWNYAICSKKLINSKGIPNGNAIEGRIKPEYSSFPVFEYNEWNEWVKLTELNNNSENKNLKEEKTMDTYTLVGSKALLLAFCEEAGLNHYTGDFKNWNYKDYPNLKNDNNKVKSVSGNCGEYGKVFNLPTDWKAAMEYVKNPKKDFKFGDFTATVDIHDKKVCIAERGELTFEQCFEIWENISTINVGDYTIEYNVNSITFGCVKNIPFQDVKAVIDCITEIS